MDTDSMWYIVLSAGVAVMSIYLCTRYKKTEYPSRMENQRHIQTQTE